MDRLLFCGAEFVALCSCVIHVFSILGKRFLAAWDELRGGKAPDDPTNQAHLVRALFRAFKYRLV